LGATGTGKRDWEKGCDGEGLAAYGARGKGTAKGCAAGHGGVKEGR
jgi:hypothetical protein